MKKQIYIQSFIVAGILSAMVGMLSLNTNQAVAQTQENILETFSIINGASVRKIQPEGIRFTTHISDEEKVQLGENAEYGILLIPESSYNENGNKLEITVEGALTENATKIPTQEWKTSYSVADYSAYNSVLAAEGSQEFPQALYDVPLVARGYVISNGEVYYTTNTQTRSIGYVAEIALLNAESGDVLTKIADIAEDTLSVEKSVLSVGEQTNALFTVGGMEMETTEGVVVEWTTSDPEVVSVSNGIITALDAGEATVTVTATGTKPNASSMIKTVKITVEKEIIEIANQQVFSIYDDDYYPLDLSGYTLNEEITSITFTSADNVYGGNTVTSLNIPKEVIEESGYYTVVAETATKRYVWNDIVVADKVITTAEELAVWPSYVRPADWALNKANTYDGLVVLGANIDYNGAQYLNELQTYSANISDLHIAESGATTVSSENANIAAGYDSRFAGVFDGLGYTIHNITIGKVYAGGLFGYNFYGTVKNLAVTNIVMAPAGYAGTIANVFGGVAENIFLEGKMTRGTAPATQGLFAGVGEAGKKLTNVVGILSEVCAEIPAGQRLGVLIGHDLDELTTNDINVYGISDKVATLTRYGGAKIASKSSVLEYAETSFEAFGEYWDTANGFPIFESSKGKLAAIRIEAQVNDISVDEVQIGGNVDIIVKATDSLLANNQFGYYTLSVEELAGVSFADGVLTVDNTVANGANIIIRATNILDGSISILNLVATLEEIELNNKLLLSKYDIGNSFTMAGLGVSNLSSVQFIDVNSIATEVEVDENGFKVNALAVGYYTVKIVADGKLYVGEAIVADKVITTKAELLNWPYYIRPADWALNKTNQYDGLVVLGADIDFGGDIYWNELLSYATVNTSGNTNRIINTDGTISIGSGEENQIQEGYVSTFIGTFDGLGHCVYNIEFNQPDVGGLFGSSCEGTVRNLAVVNAYLANPNRIGAIAYEFKGVAENIFIEGSIGYSKWGSNVVGLFAGAVAATAKLDNIAVILSQAPIRNEGATSREAMVSGQCLTTQYTNIVAIGVGNRPALGSWGSNNLVNGYNTIDSFKSANVDLSSFDEYWDTENGFPIFKSAKGKLTTVTLSAQKDGENVTSVSAGESVNIAAMVKNENMSNAQLGYYVITTDTLGVTISDYTLNVGTDVVSGTEIVITATSVLDGTVSTIKLKVI